MLACVFIDGENFRNSIIELFSEDRSVAEAPFYRDDYLPKEARWDDLFDDMVRLVAKDLNVAGGDGLSRLRTYWYVIDAVDVWPPPHMLARLSDESVGEWGEKNQWNIDKGVDLPPLIEDIPAELLDRRDKIERRFSGHKVIQRGIVRNQRSIEFKASGAISYNLFNKKLGKEKTVDVNLAVDMVMMKDVYDVAVIVSGDQDHSPAVRAVKDAGKRVINISFVNEDGRSISSDARRLNELTDQTIEYLYRPFRDFLFPDWSSAEERVRTIDSRVRSRRR